MNLLMITRKIDRDDWLAGHSYEWAKNISEKLEARPKPDRVAPDAKLAIICLERGNTAGLENVAVHSLGKEAGASRWRRFWTFQKLAFQLVPEADGIFCHQNPEYAIAVWPYAFLFGKKIVSWYTHKSVTWKTRLMLRLSHLVLTASPDSFRLISSKVRAVGHGIDTAVFCPAAGAGRRPAGVYEIVSIGRISPAKSLETLVSAVNLLIKTRMAEGVRLQIFGDAALPQDRAYLELLRSVTKKLALEDRIVFRPPVPHSRVQAVYQTADVFVNLSRTGSLDKAVLEAMACGIPVITSNEAFFQMLEPFAGLTLVQPNDPKQLADRLAALQSLPAPAREELVRKLRRIVETDHSLDRLAEKIVGAFAV